MCTLYMRMYESEKGKNQVPKNNKTLHELR